MSYLTQIRNAFINRQYRITYRAVISGLLAGSHSHESVIEAAHELTVKSLVRFQEIEKRNSASSNTN